MKGHQPDLPGVSAVEIITVGYDVATAEFQRLRLERRRVIVTEVDHRHGCYHLHVERRRQPLPPDDPGSVKTSNV